MTLTVNKRVITHLGDGVTTSFPFDFYIGEAAHLKVYTYVTATGVLTEINSADYSATGLGSASGSVTYPTSGSPIPAGTSLIIQREVPYTQELDITNQDGFYPSLLEAQLDELAMQTQQLAEKVGRSLTVVTGSTGFTKDMPAKAALANRVLAFDASGEPKAGPTQTEISNAQTYATNVSNSATAAAASEAKAADWAEEAEDVEVEPGQYSAKHHALKAAASAAVIDPANFLTAANNLSDLADAPTARTNLELGSAAVETASTVGTGALSRDEQVRTDIASAATCAIFTVASSYLRVTGTTGITSFGASFDEGLTCVLVFADVLTITNGASLICQGGADITTAAGDIAFVKSEASNVARIIGYFRADGTALVAPEGLTLGTPVASTSGTAIDFTGIPSTAKQITVSFDTVSQSGAWTPFLLIQIGDSGGIETTGYVSAAGIIASTTSTGIQGSSSGFAITTALEAPTTVQGSVILTLLDPSTNTWAITGGPSGANGSYSFVYTCGGSKSLSATLDRLRITMSNGIDTFNAGKINIAYQ